MGSWGSATFSVSFAMMRGSVATRSGPGGFSMISATQMGMILLSVGRAISTGSKSAWRVRSGRTSLLLVAVLSALGLTWVVSVGAADSECSVCTIRERSRGRVLVDCPSLHSQRQHPPLGLQSHLSPGHLPMLPTVVLGPIHLVPSSNNVVWVFPLGCQSAPEEGSFSHLKFLDSHLGVWVFLVDVPFLCPSCFLGTYQGLQVNVLLLKYYHGFL
ncbi:hypothetical protein PR048_018666 [Dryococelus australis]|uniref:Uncharacterized protein n=1 Tax=Dryococelus australis TaxID=614101 RepID=A0ABQ9HCZ3_9NEOP|nr:hypothetical protein PR048_018666 [Dryococelus australis]